MDGHMKSFDEEFKFHIERMKNLLNKAPTKSFKIRLKKYIEEKIKLKEEKDKAEKIDKYQKKFISTKLH